MSKVTSMREIIQLLEHPLVGKDEIYKGKYIDVYRDKNNQNSPITVAFTSGAGTMDEETFIKAAKTRLDDFKERFKRNNDQELINALSSDNELLYIRAYKEYLDWKAES